MVACVGHGKFLVEIGELERACARLDPGKEVDDLFAVKIDYAEVFAGFDFEGVAVAGGDGDGVSIFYRRAACSPERKSHISSVECVVK